MRFLTACFVISFVNFAEMVNFQCWKGEQKGKGQSIDESSSDIVKENCCPIFHTCSREWNPETSEDQFVETLFSSSSYFLGLFMSISVSISTSNSIPISISASISVSISIPYSMSITISFSISVTIFVSISVSVSISLATFPIFIFVSNSLSISFSFSFPLLDAFLHHYKRVCPSVRPKVGPSFRWSHTS